jgi:hypothetical protein
VKFIAPASVVADPAAAAAAAVKAFEKLVDSETDLIYRQTIGDRGPEYNAAAAAAESFKAAGYPDADVPDDVSSWAKPTGKSPRWAADDILTTAAKWTAAQRQIRAARLAAKELARAGLADQDPADKLAEAGRQWGAFVAAISAALGIEVRPAA